jgi:ParB/RepB/Spo0J family partition protein
MNDDLCIRLHITKEGCMTTASDYQVIEIGKVHESKHNPRQHYDGPALEQLAESIRTAGIITPLLVRPNAKGFELAAGHRRYRAAKAIGLTDLPCLVREMTDQVFMEVLTIENLQREDVHPLDEAGGYEALMAAPYKMKVESIAARVNKSVKYIYDRVKLLALTKPARDLFWSGRIDAGHAILLARLTPAEQAKAIGTPEHDYADGGVFEPEHRLFMPDEEQGDEPQVKARSVRELQAYIDQHIRFTGRNVDPMLFPDTAAQITNATESKRKVIEITHDYRARDDVRHADKSKVYGKWAWTRADGQEESKVCDLAVLGVIASGPGRGQAFDVCIRKDKCLVHWGKEIRAREKRDKDQEKGNTAAVTKADQKAQAQRQKLEEGYEMNRRKRTDWQKITPAVMKVVEAKLPKLSTKATGPLGDILVKALMKALSNWGRAKTSLPRGKSADDLIRHLAALCLHDEASNYDSYQEFPKLAKHLGIDLSSILQSKPPVPAAKGKKAKAA